MTRSTKPIPHKRSNPRRGPLKDPAYLNWIRLLPCLCCEKEDRRHEAFKAIIQGRGIADVTTHVAYPNQQTRTEAAHVGDRGLGQKCSDHEAIPLCAAGHHRLGEWSAHRMGKNFWAHHGLDRDKIIAELNRLYEEQR